MSRPKKERIVCLDPNIKCFWPKWSNTQEIVEIYCDELEAIKLVNLKWLSMKQWWKKLWISASTFNRILNAAHKKISDCVINGKVLAVKKCW